MRTRDELIALGLLKPASESDQRVSKPPLTMRVRDDRPATHSNRFGLVVDANGVHWGVVKRKKRV